MKYAYSDETVNLLLGIVIVFALGYFFGRFIIGPIWEIITSNRVPISEEGEEFLGKRKVL